MLHVPVLRAGREYRSLDRARLPHVATGEPVAEVSQANAGLIARDLLDAPANRRILAERSAAELREACAKAARLFAGSELPLDDATGQVQTADDYIEALSGTTGMPRALCLANMDKIGFVLEHMDRVLGGLTRGLDLEALDRGYVIEDGRPVSYLSETDALGAVLPSNSPGVHSLWIPSVALKVPLVLKPGALEPWTPSRIARALVAAGLPGEAISVYPADHAGATQILLRAGRSMLFGDESTVAPWRDDRRVQLHGPGWSKIVFGADRADDWAEHIELMADSVVRNGGRSCVNASGVWTPANGRLIAEALADRLAGIEARALDDPEAGLAAFPRPEVAQAISDHLDRQLEIPGAVDLTAARRGGARVTEVAGCTFLLPTVVWCEDPGHPLAATELLFPFVSVVETPRERMLEQMGASLVVTAITDDPQLRQELMAARNVDRLNLGPLPTCVVSWDQPHEGNLFDHLYRQRAFQSAGIGDSASAA
jgi:acyl-CoA reductase-like NAD-dependent aldehyde dehydrogenase